MTVKAILSQKGRHVITIAPGAPLADAVKALADHGIGAVVVHADDGVGGILSERDIVRALGRHGAAALTHPVADIMTRRVVTCRERDTIGQIMESMTSGKFRHLPVVEEGTLVGIVSIGDVVKQRIAEVERESSAMREYILTA